MSSHLPSSVIARSGRPRSARQTVASSASRAPAALWRVWAVTVLVAASGTAQAQPEAAPAQPDRLLSFLQDRNLSPALIATQGAAAARRVRDKAADLVITALNFLDVPYRLGGNTAAEGFDCSGFTRHIFANSLGLILPRRAEEQAHAPGARIVEQDELKPGDLVFFNTLKRTFSHVGIYVGEGRFIHAPRTGAEVRVESMRVGYWQQRFNGARRVDAIAQVEAIDPSFTHEPRSLTP